MGSDFIFARDQKCLQSAGRSHQPSTLGFSPSSRGWSGSKRTKKQRCHKLPRTLSLQQSKARHV